MIKNVEITIAIATLTMLLLAAFILYLAVFNKYIKVPDYNRAICNINDEKLEIKINDIKVLSDSEYLITNDNDEKWLVSSYYCTFVEE